MSNVGKHICIALPEFGDLEKLARENTDYQREIARQPHFELVLMHITPVDEYD